MKPADLLCALVSVYPPDLSAAARTGHLPGERHAGKVGDELVSNIEHPLG